MRIDQAKYIIETNGKCLENHTPDFFILCCKDCPCYNICGSPGTENIVYQNRKNKRIYLAKQILRKDKLNRILNEENYEKIN
jgi:hypothetical protein